ncbi:alpha/beta fold hydrolase [Aquisalimonas asiatica]|uniref:Pimeloyl-ACP methyl ester carboxylesterase n=1 Tax=Aquisalimonas asiatica TaxID=406100 RepID=A0A1H8UDU0_9GAMM|nr:alpha/beta fold hydrolase [Aquisalimonas asiatica]SEP01389.1 Pimeloyl-ACP methyl ester carboxylesterase [Aquisalimonas asiatica]
MSETLLHTRIQGEGHAVVILHGLFGSGSNWNRIARDLATDHQVVVMDLPNHGQSPHVETMAYPDMAAAVANTLDHYGIPPGTIIGHSMGGKVAMALALTDPAYVRRLLIGDIAPIRYGDHGHGRLLRALQRMDPQRLGSRAAASEALAEDIPEAGLRQFLLTNLESRDGAFAWRIPLQALEANLPTIADFPDMDGHYDGPTLFLHGANSDYVPESAHDAIHALFPAAAIEPLPDAGHWLHAEQPQAFLERTRRFLEAGRNAA